MAVIFAVVGGAAVIGIAGSDTNTHSDYSDYYYSDYSNHSDYSDAAVRRERKRNELNKNIDSERSSALSYIDQTVKPYINGTKYSNYTSSIVFDMSYDILNNEVKNKINSDCINSINSEKSAIEKEIKDVDAMLDLLNRIELETKQK